MADSAEELPGVAGVHKRILRQQGMDELRAVWQEALADRAPGVAVDEVLGRLQRKYQALADASDVES